MISINDIKRFNDIDLMISIFHVLPFNSEKIGYKNSSAHEHLSKKYGTLFTLMAKNDVKRFDWFKNLT